MDTEERNCIIESAHGLTGTHENVSYLCCSKCSRCFSLLDNLTHHVVFLFNFHTFVSTRYFAISDMTDPNVKKQKINVVLLVFKLSDEERKQATTEVISVTCGCCFI